MDVVLGLHPGSAWNCWAALEADPSQVLKDVAVTVLAQYLIPIITCRKHS
jgi:hypothetical protein